MNNQTLGMYEAMNIDKASSIWHAERTINGWVMLERYRPTRMVRPIIRNIIGKATAVDYTVRELSDIL